MKAIRTLYHYFIPQKMPDWAALYYEKLIDGITDFYIQPFCEKILTKYPDTSRLLDIGTGTGQLPVMLAQKNKNYALTAIDLSRECIAIAKSKAALAKVDSRITFACVDILRDQWETEPFDLIISTCSLHHWSQPECILSRAGQLLAENGEIWILDDLANISPNARRDWINKVDRACNPGWLFKTVFRFESGFLAYSYHEFEELCRKAGLSVRAFSNEGVFFISQMVKAT